MNHHWIDITRPTFAGMAHWPGDPEVEVERFMDIRRGDHCNVSRVSMCVHAGTHIDAPLHFISDGDGAESAALDVMIGPARVIAIDDQVSVRRSALEPYDLQPGERVLFKTRNGLIPWEGPFVMEYIYIAADAAEYLAERRVALVGIDGMSVGGFYNDMVECHLALLNGGIWIVENLDLRAVKPGRYELMCLPMKLVGCDGAPARVLLRPLG